MMMIIGLLVLATFGMTLAQEGTTCQCLAYFVCPKEKWNKDIECSHHNEVCCALDDATESPPGSPLPTQQPRLDNSSPPPNNEECGLRKPPAVIWRIETPEGVDGNTTRGEFPWMVAILRDTPTGRSFLCGGSIIKPNLILTAAHSVNGIPASELLVKAGVWNTTDISELLKHQDRNVLESVVHSSFNKEKVENDFAILVLTEPLVKTGEVSPVCLPSSGRTVNASACIATGWGVDKYGNENGNILKKVTLPLIDFESCRNRLKQSKLGPSFNLHNSFMCAGGGEEGDTCIGDGGGPLMCATTENSNRYVQVGITSWGTSCGMGDPGVYASVQFASDWIQQQAENYPPLIAKKQP